MRALAASLLALLLAPSLASASRLPIKTYTTADGLARDFILCIEQDSHGFLWFCTAEGLARFDGYRFTNYYVEQGLPSNYVNDFLETRKGAYWVATTGGLSRYDPAEAGASKFRRYPLNGRRGPATPSVLYEDPSGVVWCGSAGEVAGGLFRLGPGDAAFRLVDTRAPDPRVTALVMDRRGALWIGSPSGLYRLDRNGDLKSFAEAEGTPDRFVMGLIEDRSGRLWVGTRGGLVRMDPAEDPREPPQVHVYSKKEGLPSARIESLLESSDGTVWIGTNLGLAQWVPGRTREGRDFESYTLEQGLSARSVGALAEDRDGNLWIGTFGSGAMKMSRSGFTTYTEADGTPVPMSLLETREGELCALGGGAEVGPWLARFDGNRFVPIRPRWPDELTYFGWGRGQIVVEARDGEWWFATGQGLARFARVSRIEELDGSRPKAVYSSRDGLPGDDIFRVFEDSRGDVWIGTIGLGEKDGLSIWERATGRVHAFSQSDGLPAHPTPTALAEDRAGDVWVGLFHGGLARYRHGRFETFDAARGVVGAVRRLFVDSAGRLWIGTSLGLLRVDEPAAERPRFVTYGPAQGLSSYDVAAIAEDGWGRIYAATGRGVDRFQPRPGGPTRVQHYTTADGIAAGELQLALRDRHGTLWFSTPLGISRFAPAPDRPQAPPPVLITGVSIGDVPRPISDLGETSVSGLTLRRAPVRIDFVGLGFSPGEALRYQYRLEGADRDWGPLTDQRAVVYAHLSPGDYRFLVRAVGSEGAASPSPAAVTFTVLPPVWRSWWFLISCGLATLLLIYALHRYRLAQLLALAEIRTRIATDLHDDIGASLSRIAILSEVARRPADGDAGSSSQRPLSEIAGISRELVDSMSDIVWAINPEHDRLSDLVHRMRRFATDLLGGQKIALRFRSSIAEDDTRVDANARRQVYLIFKEAIHNAARHAGASRVDVDLESTADRFVLRVADDGKGFDPGAEYEGHGLMSMRRRAAAVRGALEVRSTPGRGSLVALSIPLAHSRTLSVLRGKAGSRFR